MTASTRCVQWVQFRECGDLLYGGIFPLKLKWAAYTSYVGPAVVCWSEVSCLRDNLVATDPWREQCVEYSSKI